MKTILGVPNTRERHTWRSGRSGEVNLVPALPVQAVLPSAGVVWTKSAHNLVQVLELVSVGMADGSIVDFHCDLNSRPITPVHSSDYIFREERTSPYWPGDLLALSLAHHGVLSNGSIAVQMCPCAA